MKNSKNIVCVIACLQLIILITISQRAKAQNKPSRYSADFTVIVRDTTLMKHTTLNFQIQTQGINTDYGNYNKTISLPLNGPVSRIKIPLDTRQNYLRIIQLRDGLNSTDRVFNYASNLFIVEQGDKIELHLAKDPSNVIFKGKNSAKYNCAFQMGNLTAYNVDIFNRYAAAGNFDKAFEHSVFQHDSIFRLQTKTLSRYQSKIQKNVYNLMCCDIESFRNQRIAGLCQVPYFLNHIEQLPAAKKTFNNYFNNLGRLKNISTDIAIKSYLLSDYLVEREKTSIAINKSTTNNNYFRKQNFGDLDSAINHDFPNGILKDKMMLVSFISISRKLQPDYVYYIKPAIRNSQNNKFRAEIKSFEQRNSKGHSTFNFALQDTSGRIHQLKDYQGKVVVIDFWFTGCHGCLGMAPFMKTFSERYKSDPNIVFLTISVDRDKNRWLGSIRKKLYSGGDEINLLGENGEQSQIVKYFNITGYPTLVVFGKDGKLISAAPPDPRDNLIAFEQFLESHI